MRTFVGLIGVALFGASLAVVIGTMIASLDTAVFVHLNQQVSAALAH